MKKITKRDIGFFVLGLLAMLLIELVFDWERSVQDFKDGFNSVPDIESTK
jgi:hypothetical protein